ncbi:MAG: outer rane efflux protein [Ignavibacteria bacterium]|nr:outer rane efflux protein [Ignavibacteria bacterium]
MKSWIVIIFFISTIGSSAQRAGVPYSNDDKTKLPPQLSLNQCLQLALKQNFDIILNAPKKESAEAALSSAFATYLPSVYFNSGYRHEFKNYGTTISSNSSSPNNPYDSSTNSVMWAAYRASNMLMSPILSQMQNSNISLSNNYYNMSLSANLILFDGMNREANLEKAKKSVEAVIKSNNQLERNVLISVYRDYIDVIRNKQIVHVRNENFNLGNKELERIQAQYSAGVVPMSNVYAQQADLGSRELELITADNNVRLSKAKLLINIGYNADTAIDFENQSLPDSITNTEMQQFRTSVGSYEECMKKAMSKRNDFAAAGLAVESAHSGITAAQSGYYPRISASGGWSWANSEFSQFDQGLSSFGLSLSFPVFDNLMTRSQVQSAQLQLEQRKVEQLHLEQQIRGAVQAAFLILDAAEKQIEITNRAMRSALMNYESTNERYKVGAANITELQTANNQLVGMQINRVNAVYNYIMAQKELLYAIGEL